MIRFIEIFEYVDFPDIFENLIEFNKILTFSDYAYYFERSKNRYHGEEEFREKLERNMIFPLLVNITIQGR